MKNGRNKYPVMHRFTVRWLILRAPNGRLVICWISAETNDAIQDAKY